MHLKVLIKKDLWEYCTVKKSFFGRLYLRPIQNSYRMFNRPFEESVSFETKKAQNGLK